MPRQPRKSTAKGLQRKYGKKTVPAVSKIQAVVRRAIVANDKKNLEVKKSTKSYSDGTQIAHNNFVIVDTNPFTTSQGTANPENSIFDNRVGDKITLRGLKMTFMFELNERYSDVTLRILLVKCAKGDTPTTATLFNSISGNKMIDTLNRDRYTIVYQQYLKLKSPNIASNGVASGGLLSGAGTFDMLNGQQTVLTRATKIVKVWIPGNKFSKSGVIQYENGSSQLKFFDYKVLVYAYSNFSTSEALGFNVARVNDYISQIYYTDA